jgi:pimeloyl-ACP methyl ester carboxylesterase
MLNARDLTPLIIPLIIPGGPSTRCTLGRMLTFVLWSIACGQPPVPATMPVPTTATAAPALTGDWLGHIAAGGSTVRVILHLADAGTGPILTLDSPDQGAYGLTCSDVAVTADTLTFAIPVAKARFEGHLVGARLEGTWTQGAASLPIAFERSADAAPPKRPQVPVPPLPYSAIDVEFPSSPGVTLAGTLTRPPGDAKVPAVVLVSGSGPQDRDESLMGHQPFLVLADAITRKGIAVLRYDDRGMGRSTGDFSAGTTNDFADDAAAAVRYLATRTDVDAAKIAVLGHSEGGVIAPMVANREKVAAIVLMAGPGVVGRTVIEGQVEALALATGMSAADAKAARAEQAKILDVVVAGKSAADVSAYLVTLGAPPAVASAQAQTLTSPWYRNFLGIDPAPELKKLRVPVLALVGDKDVQVVATDNIPALKAALADDPGATVETMPGLNHLFQPATTGSPDEYATIDTTIDPTALERISGWLATTLGR